MRYKDGTAAGSVSSTFEAQYRAHKNRKKESLEMKMEDMTNSAAGARTITFDLEAILYIPQAQNSELFYKRKLHVYNLTIYDCLSAGHCYMWDETHGREANSEVFSCLLTYISQLPDNITQLITWSDTCAGQNQNKYLLAFMLFAVNSPNNPNLQTIDVKYMESGHSYLECNSMHSMIERAKKHRRIYTPGKMRLIVEEARRNPQPYQVQQMDFSQFLDFKNLFDHTVMNFSLTSDGKKVSFLKVKLFRFQRGSSNILFKYNYKDEFSSMNFLAEPPSPPK